MILIFLGFASLEQAQLVVVTDFDYAGITLRRLAIDLEQRRRRRKMKMKMKMMKMKKKM